jgi:hypothetical protein
MGRNGVQEYYANLLSEYDIYYLKMSIALYFTNLTPSHIVTDREQPALLPVCSVPPALCLFRRAHDRR